MGLLDSVISTVNKELTGKEKQEKNELPKSEVELIERRERAEKMIHNKSLMSSAAAIVPIPGVDVGVDLKLMTSIIEDINRVYGLSHQQVNGMTDDLKQKVMLTAAKQGSEFAGKKISKAVVFTLLKTIARSEAAKQAKWIPVVGQAISGSISYYMMKRIGLMHIDKCERIARELVPTVQA